MRKTTVVMLVLLMVGVVVGVWAQTEEEAAPLMGTVCLRSGQVLSGVIRVAEFGVVPGAGVGMLLPDRGSVVVEVDGTEHTVPAAELASVEAIWANEGTEAEPQWKIQQLTVTTQAGETIVGRPTWLLHASEVSIEGGPTIHAFPLAGTDFSADNLIAKIVIGELAPPAEAAPVEELAAEVEAPAEPPAEEPPVTEVEAPTEAPAEAPAVAVTVPAEEVHITIPPIVVAPPTEVIIGEGSFSFTVTCPKCGQKIKITVNVEAAPAD